MAVPKQLAEAVGSWRGKSELHRSWLSPDKQVSGSDSHFHIQADTRHKFLKIEYAWSVDGKAQEGEMILCQAAKGDAVEIGWADSWHQSGAVMHLVGTTTANGVQTKGSFDAGGEKWGWTIDLTLEGDRLLMTMNNVTPQGEATWAVKADYRRV
jgi:hypothetical protein